MFESDSFKGNSEQSVIPSPTLDSLSMKQHNKPSNNMTFNKFSKGSLHSLKGLNFAPRVRSKETLATQPAGTRKKNVNASAANLQWLPTAKVKRRSFNAGSARHRTTLTRDPGPTTPL